MFLSIIDLTFIANNSFAVDKFMTDKVKAKP